MASAGWIMCIRRIGSAAWQLDAAASNPAKSIEAEYRLRGKDGQYRWFRARAVPIRDQTRRDRRWYGTCSDIHDSKLLEQSIRESALELEKMVDERTAALRRLSGRLMTMQDEERRRIARELHDGLGQELVARKDVAERNSPSRANPEQVLRRRQRA